jgi:hypothetical protein
MTRCTLPVLVAAALAAGACTDDLVCTTSIEPGVVVEIRDAVDANPLADHATGTVRDGTYTDALRPYASTGEGVLLSRAAADERAGTYVVEVSHPGYITWEQSGVQVTENACHVDTVHLVAELERAP